MADQEYETFHIDDAELRIPAASLNDRLRGRLRDGGYEHYERAHIRAYLRPGDRVLDLGSGAGLVAIVAARIVGAANVTTVEPNPEMHQALRRNLRRNAGEELRLIKGAVVGDGYAEKTVTLNLRSAFWAASIGGPPGKNPRLVDVPAKKLSRLIAARDATVLSMDIEGAEADLLAAPLPAQIRLVLMELHPGIYGEAVRDRLLASLEGQGFANLGTRKAEEVYAFGRETA